MIEARAPSAPLARAGSAVLVHLQIQHNILEGNQQVTWCKGRRRARARATAQLATSITMIYLLAGKLKFDLPHLK